MPDTPLTRADEAIADSVAASRAAHAARYDGALPYSAWTDRLERSAHARAHLAGQIKEHAAEAIGYATALQWAGATGNGRGVQHHADMLRSHVHAQLAALAAYEEGV